MLGKRIEKKFPVVFALIAVALLAGGLLWRAKYPGGSQPENGSVSDLFSQAQRAAFFGKHTLAVDLYRALLNKDPTHRMALEFLAQSQSALQDWGGAAATYEKMIQWDPTPKNFNQLILFYEKSRQAAKAQSLREHLSRLKTSVHRNKNRR